MNGSFRHGNKYLDSFLKKMKICFVGDVDVSLQV